MCIFCFHCSLTVCPPLSRKKIGRISQFISFLLPTLKSSRNLRFFLLKTHKYSHPKCTRRAPNTHTNANFPLALTLVFSRSRFLAWKLMDDSCFFCLHYLFISFFCYLWFCRFFFLSIFIYVTFLFLCLHLICLIRKITHSQPCDLCKWFSVVCCILFVCFVSCSYCIVCSRRSCSSSFVLPSGSFV